jgi:O-antigen/teichoic acid export membrane protein
MSQEQSPSNESVNERSDRIFKTAHLMNSLGGRTARGGLVTLVSHGVKFAISIVATAILARLLSPQDYGLIGMVGVASNFIAMFKDLGLSLATVQRSEISAEQISTLFWINLLLSLATMGVLVALAPGVAWFYGEPRLTSITIVSAFGFIIGGLAVQHEALLKRQMRFFALSVIALVSMTMGYVAGITFAWYGFRFWSLVFSQLALLTTNVILVWIVCWWVPGLPRRNTGVRSMLRFGGHITGYATINYFSKNADNLLIGRSWGAQPLGLYNKASQLVGLPTDQFNEPLMSVTIPALSRLVDSPERYRNAYRRMMEKVLILIMPGVGLLMVSADWVVSIVLGPQWKDATPILVFMSVAGLLQPIVSTGGWLLVTQGRGRHMLYWSLINAPISVLSIVIGLPWGPVGVAASYSLIRVFVTNPLMYWYVGRQGPVRTSDFYRLLASFGSATTVGILACLLFRRLVEISNPVLGIAACFFLMALSTLITLFIIPSGRLALRDIKGSLSLLRPVPSDAAVET